MLAERDQAGFANSLWVATAIPAPSTPPLEGEGNADVCVIGAGFAGLSTALHLAEAGVDVSVLEAAVPGWGASGRNGGQVIPGLRLEVDELSALYGIERGERLFEFAGTFADFTFALIGRLGLDCHAEQSGWIQPAHGAGPLRRLQRRFESWAERGAPVEMLDRSATAKLLGSDWYVGGYLDRRGGLLQPLSFARAMAAAAQAGGARIHGNSAVRTLTRDDRGWRIETAGGAVRTEQVILCTNAYAALACGEGLWPGLARSIVPVYSYQVATRPLSDNGRATILPGGHAVSDLRRLIAYFRLDPEGRLVMGGRGGLDGNLNLRRFGHVIARLQQILPRAGEVEPEFFWNGPVALTLDHVPHVHAPAPGLWIAHGWNGRGVAAATALGKTMADLACGMDRTDCALPFTEIAPIPFHGARLPAMKAMVWWKQFSDWVETSRSRR